jgi:hypothetical protein
MANRDGSLRKIVVLLEEQMASLGLSEAEKNAKTAELVAFVGEAVSAKRVAANF